MIKKVLKWVGVAVLIFFGAAKNDRKKIARVLEDSERDRNLPS